MEDQEIVWRDGAIEDCPIEPLAKYSDDRGWLAEFFRRDELSAHLFPAMGYISLTRSGITRGPHEHEHQTDLFLFYDGVFRLYLWDGRPDSSTRGNRQIIEVGSDNPVVAIIPPGVVHAYSNVGDRDAYVVNCPNRLYAGEGKAEPVDEIRHEDRPDSRFVID